MKVLIADPQPKVRHALSIWISGQPGWEIVGEAGSAVDLINKLDQLSPGVVILDRELPGLPAGELVARVRLASQGVAIILLIGGPMERCQADALDADFYVSKVDPPNHMLDAILKAKHRLESKREST
jgi:DNA-binding NarL/FixJ family response regulator